MADPQHPDIAALIEQRDRAWKALRFIYRNGMHADRPKWLDPILSDAFGPERGDGPGMARDAERDRTREGAVAEEEVRRVETLLRSTAKTYGDREMLSELLDIAASLLARLAREKASAEQERDGVWRRLDEMLAAQQAVTRQEKARADVWEGRATRAEQEAARLRDLLRRLRELPTEPHPPEGLVSDEDDVAAHREWMRQAADLDREVERALAAAAGAEEPRSARPISEQTQAELKALDEAAGMGRHRLRSFLTGKAEEPR